MLRSSINGLVAASIISLILQGCGDGPATFDPSTAYSPESLASELVFRYKTLDPKRRNVPKPQSPRKPSVSTKDAKAETKQAQSATLDDLVRETVIKAGTVPGMSKAEAIGKVADQVGKDASISDEDRKVIAERLRSEGG